MVKTVDEMSDEEIKDAVSKRYGKVATAPDGQFNFPVGRKLKLQMLRRESRSFQGQMSLV